MSARSNCWCCHTNEDGGAGTVLPPKHHVPDQGALVEVPVAEVIVRSPVTVEIDELPIRLLPYQERREYRPSDAFPRDTFTGRVVQDVETPNLRDQPGAEGNFAAQCIAPAASSLVYPAKIAITAAIVTGIVRTNKVPPAHDSFRPILAAPRPTSTHAQMPNRSRKLRNRSR